MSLHQSNVAALESMCNAAIVAGESVAALVSSLENFGNQLYALAWDAYMKAGAPYGETREGLNRWLDERQYLGEE